MRVISHKVTVNCFLNSLLNGAEHVFNFGSVCKQAAAIIYQVRNQLLSVHCECITEGTWWRIRKSQKKQNGKKL